MASGVSRTPDPELPPVDGHRLWGDRGHLGKEVQMPRPHPPELHRRAVELEGVPDFAEEASGSVNREEPADGFGNSLQRRVQN